MVRYGVVVAGSMLAFIACSSEDPDPGSLKTGSSSGSPDDDDDDDDDDDTTTPKTVDGTRYVNALCNHFQKCSPHLFARYDGECATKVKAEFDRKRKAPDDATKQADVDGCAAVYEKDDCSGQVSQDAFCIFRGTRKPGAACATDAQCVTGLCAKASYDDDCGVCTEYAAVGKSCALATCVRGAYCDENRLCVAMVERDGACQPFQCAPGLACVGGKCATPLTANKPCTGPAECLAPLECVDSVCKSVAVDIAAPGEPCGTAANFPSCRRSTCSTATEKCLARSPIGGACDPTFAETNCDHFLQCKNEKCKAFEFDVCDP